MAENTQEKKGFWDYATPILTGMGAAAVTGAYNNYAVNKQNEYNAAQAQINRDYETQMSNTAYQRAYADMAAAGLNPHLAGGQGGASTPAGTTATGAQAMPLDIAGAVNAASNAALTRAQLSNIEADTELKGKQAGKTKAERNLIETQEKLQTITTAFQEKLAAAQTAQAKAAEKQNAANALTTLYTTMYTEKYGHAPNASAIDRAAGKFDKLLQRATSGKGMNMTELLKIMMSN